MSTCDVSWKCWCWRCGCVLCGHDVFGRFRSSVPERAAWQPQVYALVCARGAAQGRMFTKCATSCSPNSYVIRHVVDWANRAAAVGRDTAVSFIVMMLSSGSSFGVVVVGGGGSEAGLEAPSDVALSFRARSPSARSEKIS